MSLGLIIGPVGNPYTLQANPVEFNYLLYSRQFVYGSANAFQLGLGPLSFGYTLKTVALNGPAILSASAVGFAYTLETASLNYVTVAATPLGTNLEPSSYYSGTIAYLNLMKQALPGGSYAGNNTRWRTLNGSGVDTQEEAYLASVLDANGYPTSLTAPVPGGQAFTNVETILCLSQNLGEGCTTTYEPGTYRVKYIGQGTLKISGDASLTLSNSTPSTYVTGTFTVTTTSSLFLQITAVTSGTDYPRDISVVNTLHTAAFDSGSIFHPFYLATIANLTSLRPILSTGSYGAYTQYSPASYPINAGVTSITLASAWVLPSQTRKLYMIDGEVFNATFTQGSAVVQLNGTLANTISSSTYNGFNFFCACVVSWVDNFANRTLPSNLSWAPDTYHQQPLEVMIALCNANNSDLYLNIPPTITLADAVSCIQAIINGTGLQAGWSPLNSNLKVRIEYANETWSGVEFEQAWCTIFGTAMWYPSQGSGNSFSLNRNWYGYYIIQIANAMQTALGSSVFNARVVPVMGAQGQAPNSSSVTSALWNSSSYWAGSPASNDIVSAIAIATYWPVSYTGWISVADATTLVANGLTDFFLLATTNTPPTASGGSGHTYSSVNAAGYLGQMESFYSTWTALSADYDIIQYEGNTSFVPSDDNGVSGGTVTGWGNFIISAMRDPTMQALFTTYLNSWPFGTSQANIRHIYRDCQSYGSPITTSAGQGAFNLIESTMQMNGSTPLATGKYYKWAAVQDYVA
jgi:hypothetical protein